MADFGAKCVNFQTLDRTVSNNIVAKAYGYRDICGSSHDLCCQISVFSSNGHFAAFKHCLYEMNKSSNCSYCKQLFYGLSCNALLVVNVKLTPYQ